jgi:hypothetical protein
MLVVMITTIRFRGEERTNAGKVWGEMKEGLNERATGGSGLFLLKGELGVRFGKEGEQKSRKRDEASQRVNGKGKGTRFLRREGETQC